MTYETKPIEYRGYSLLRLLSSGSEKFQSNAFQMVMFRAGQAHAGVIVILSPVCQVLTHMNATAPNRWIKLLYAGIFILGAPLITFGIGLL